MSLFARVSVIEESKTDTAEKSKKSKEVACGVFIPLPYDIAKRFPDKSEEDTSVPHVTMLYIGECSPDAQTKVVKAVQEVLRDWPPFRVDVFGYDEFVNPKGQTIAHMAPSAVIPVRADGVVTYRTLGQLHADLYAAVEETGVKVEHEYGKKKPAFAARADAFKSHTTLAYVNKGEPSYSGPKPTGSFMVTELEVWGHETYRLPLGRTKSDQPCPAAKADDKAKKSDKKDPEPSVAGMTRAPAPEPVKTESLYERASRAASLIGEANDRPPMPKSAKPKPAFGAKPQQPQPVQRPIGGAPSATEPPADAHGDEQPSDEDPNAGHETGDEAGQMGGPTPFDGAAHPHEMEQTTPVHRFGHAIIIGVEHGKPINLPPERIAEVQQLAKHGVYFEGAQPEPAVSDFVAQNLGHANMQSWELAAPMPGEHRWHPEVALSMFGGDTDTLHHQVTTHPNFDSNKSVHDNLLATADAWHHPHTGAHVSSHDLNHLTKSISDDPHSGAVTADASAIHKFLHGPMDGFKKFHKAGAAAMFPHDSGFHEHHTKISRIADMANTARDAHLAHMMRTKGGVYFAGKDHVPAAAARLARKGGTRKAKVESQPLPPAQPQVAQTQPQAPAHGQPRAESEEPRLSLFARVADEQSDMPGNKYASVPAGSARTGIGTAPAEEVPDALNPPEPTVNPPKQGMLPKKTG